MEQVTVVVNFDLPTLDGKPDNETYLHRIGRTGRFGKNGIAINMVDSSRSMNTMKSIENHFGKWRTSSKHLIIHYYYHFIASKCQSKGSVSGVLETEKQ